MKTVIVREIMALVLRPSSAPAAVAPSSTPANKHIRFNDSEPSKSKSKPANSGTDKKSGGGNAHARYYATITFNQIVLSPGDREVALKLIEVYFELFKELLGEGAGGSDDVRDPEEEAIKNTEFKMDKGGRIRDGGKGKGKGKVNEVRGAAGFTEVEDAHSKLISAILTGVNRALPFAKIDAGDSGCDSIFPVLFPSSSTR
jgi:ribosome biogenesis protein MAK21